MWIRNTGGNRRSSRSLRKEKHNTMKKRIIKIPEEVLAQEYRRVERFGRDKLIRQIEALAEDRDGDRLIISGTRWEFLKKL